MPTSAQVPNAWVLRNLLIISLRNILKKSFLALWVSLYPLRIHSSQMPLVLKCFTKSCIQLLPAFAQNDTTQKILKHQRHLSIIFGELSFSFSTILVFSGKHPRGIYPSRMFDIWTKMSGSISERQNNFRLTLVLWVAVVLFYLTLYCFHHHASLPYQSRRGSCNSASYGTFLYFTQLFIMMLTVGGLYWRGSIRQMVFAILEGCPDIVRLRIHPIIRLNFNLAEANFSGKNMVG